MNVFHDLIIFPSVHTALNVKFISHIELRGWISYPEKKQERIFLDNIIIKYDQWTEKTFMICCKCNNSLI